MKGQWNEDNLFAELWDVDDKHKRAYIMSIKLRTKNAIITETPSLKENYTNIHIQIVNE